MKTFLRVVLLVLLAILALKILPLVFGLGCLVAVGVLVAIAVGVSAIVALVGGAIAIVAALAPIWIPVLAIVGVIALVKRGSRKNGGIAA